MLSQKPGLRYEKTSKRFGSGLQRPDSAFARRSDHDFVEILRSSLRNYNHDTTKFEAPIMSRKMSLTKPHKLIRCKRIINNNQVLRVCPGEVIHCRILCLLSSGAKCNPGVTEGARYSFSPSRLCPLETEQKAGVRNGKPDFSSRNQ
jgi:hypothetical protein